MVTITTWIYAFIYAMAVNTITQNLEVPIEERYIIPALGFVVLACGIYHSVIELYLDSGNELW